MFTMNKIQKRIYHLKKVSTQWRVPCFLRNGKIQSELLRSLWIFFIETTEVAALHGYFFSVMFLFNFLGLSLNFMQKSTNIYVLKKHR